MTDEASAAPCAACEESKAAALAIVARMVPLVADAAIVGASYGWREALQAVEAVATRLEALKLKHEQGLHLRALLKDLPESGMGYHTVLVKLPDGRIFDAVVLNSEVLVIKAERMKPTVNPGDSLYEAVDAVQDVANRHYDILPKELTDALFVLDFVVWGA